MMHSLSGKNHAYRSRTYITEGTLDFIHFSGNGSGSLVGYQYSTISLSIGFLQIHRKFGMAFETAEFWRAQHFFRLRNSDGK